MRQFKVETNLLVENLCTDIENAESIEIRTPGLSKYFKVENLHSGWQTDSKSKSFGFYCKSIWYSFIVSDKEIQDIKVLMSDKTQTVFYIDDCGKECCLICNNSFDLNNDYKVWNDVNIK